MEWDWKDRGDAWLRLKLRDIREELDGGERDGPPHEVQVRAHGRQAGSLVARSASR